MAVTPSGYGAADTAGRNRSIGATEAARRI